MAALTANRHGKFTPSQRMFYEDFKLDDAGTKIFSHSLICFGSNNGLEPATATSTGPIMYADVYYDASSNNLRFDGFGANGLARALSGVVALLDGTGFSAGDEGTKVYADDDHIVSASSDSEEIEQFAIVAGGAAGNHTVTGIDTSDTLVSVLQFDRKASALQSAVVAGANASGTAQSITLTGITTDDSIVSVTRIVGSGVDVTDTADVTDKFTITGADTIEQADTDMSADELLVLWHDDTVGDVEVNDLTSEFSIDSANTVDNAGGTDTTGDNLLVVYRTGESRPYVGIVTRVIDANEVYVFIPGLLNN